MISSSSISYVAWLVSLLLIVNYNVQEVKMHFQLWFYVESEVKALLNISTFKCLEEYVIMNSSRQRMNE